MGRKRHTAEQIIGKLRTAEIELAKGLGTAEVGTQKTRAAAESKVNPIENVPALDLLVECAHDESDDALIFTVLCLDGGLRAGEARALEWGDITWGDRFGRPSMEISKSRSRGSWEFGADQKRTQAQSRTFEAAALRTLRTLQRRVRTGAKDGRIGGAELLGIRRRPLAPDHEEGRPSRRHLEKLA